MSDMNRKEVACFDVYEWLNHSGKQRTVMSPLCFWQCMTAYKAVKVYCDDVIVVQIIATYMYDLITL